MKNKKTSLPDCPSVIPEPKKKNDQYTFEDLKKFCNQLTEEQLNQPVIWWGDERGGIVSFAEITRTELIATDEGWEEVCGLDDEYLNLYNTAERLPKGTPALQVD